MTRDLYCWASSSARAPRPVSSTTVPSTHSAAPGPVVPEPILTRDGAAHHRAGLAAGQPSDLLDHGERADAREPAVGQPRHEQHPRLNLRTHAGNLPGRHPGRVDGGANLRLRRLQRHHHPRQHHFVIERQHRQRERFTHMMASV